MCGIAFVRLRKPFEYYAEKYNTPLYGLKKLYLLMQKQHNRGQDGAGVANVKLNLDAGKRYISRYKSVEEKPMEAVFKRIYSRIDEVLEAHPDKKADWEFLKEHTPFLGEIYLGHLRYGTYGANAMENCHPFLRQNNWRSKNLIVAGNFNLTNVEELFDILMDLGQHPKDKVDTVIAMEKIGHFLDEENERIYEKYKDQYSKREMTEVIEDKIDLNLVLSRALRDFDGGYSLVGMTGYGGGFVVRDPRGIRPAYYYADDEVVVAASEKPAIKTAFGIDYNEIQEIPPAHALVVNKKGEYEVTQVLDTKLQSSCTFERIYFSRSSDPVIYNERKQLGRLLMPQILKAVDYDLENTVFSYIPNTAESAFLGMMKGIEHYLIDRRKKSILNNGKMTAQELDRLMSFRPRVEKLVVKDAKLRTFISDDNDRDDLVKHAYDTTYELVRKGVDTLVVIDDSIVRGTTLEKSIIRMLDKLNPKKIVIVSSAPQIRFPDCYGINMSKMKEFVAFRAVLALLEETKQSNLLDQVLERCQIALEEGTAGNENYVNALYAPFSYEQVSDKIAEIIRADDVKAEVQVIYQSVEHLHEACPNHSGDWYFTGEYPTEGGNRVVNQAFVNFMKGSLERAY